MFPNEGGGLGQYSKEQKKTTEMNLSDPATDRVFLGIEPQTVRF